MTSAFLFRISAILVFCFRGAAIFAADDIPFKEAQEAILGELDRPLAKPGQYSLHLRFQDFDKRKGERVTCEFWNPKLHIRLVKGDSEQSAADKLNGKVEPLWKGVAIFTADAYRLALSSDFSGASPVQYEPWKSLNRPKFFGFWMSKTQEGWKVRKTSNTRGFDGPYDKEFSLSQEVPAEPKATISEREMATAFAEKIRSQAGESLVIVERRLSKIDGTKESDTSLEFHAPKIEYVVQNGTVAEALNGDAAIRVNVRHDAVRTLKVLKWDSDSPRDIEMQKVKTVYPTKWEKAGGVGEYYGVRKAGKWTFTIYAGGDAESLNFLDRLILPSKGSPE